MRQPLWWESEVIVILPGKHETATTRPVRSRSAIRGRVIKHGVVLECATMRRCTGNIYQLCACEAIVARMPRNASDAWIR